MTPAVSALIAHKGRSLVTIPLDATVFEAIGRMVEANVGAILVADAEGEVQGIFTERDYLRRIALEGRTSRETAVQDVMTQDLITVTPDTSVADCLSLMTDHKIRHLPVMHAGHLVGVISIGDCVRALADAAKGEAEELRRFVSGGYMG